jgi:SAM-dependent methyltransferase
MSAKMEVGMPRTIRRLMRKYGLKGSKPGRAIAPSRMDIRRPHQPNVGLPREILRDDHQTRIVDQPFRHWLNDPAVRAAIERDAVPIPAREDREGFFGDRHLSYWLSGYDDLNIVRNVVPRGAFQHVLDFGGATGRFARHVILADAQSTVTLVDLNANHIAWVEKHFPSSVRAAKVSPYPHFPLADSSVTLCVGMSVFTHIDSYESGWLAEIHRVLVPDGYAFITIHSEHTWPLLADRDDIREKLSNDARFTELFDPNAPMPDDRLVFNYDADSIEHGCDIFFHSDYIRRSWGRWFEVVGILPRAHHSFQTAVVLRKVAK